MSSLNSLRNSLFVAQTKDHPIEECRLVELLTPGIRFILRRRLQPQDVEDIVQEVIIATLLAVRGGLVRDDDALPGTDKEDRELYALCRLEERTSEEIEIHLLGCEVCRNRLLEIDQFLTAYRRLQNY